MQETVRRSRYMIWLTIYVERVTAHHIKLIDHSWFHNHLPTSKTKLNENLFESKGALRNLCILHIGMIGSAPNYTCR